MAFSWDCFWHKIFIAPETQARVLSWCVFGLLVYIMAMKIYNIKMFKHLYAPNYGDEMIRFDNSIGLLFCFHVDQQLHVGLRKYLSFLT